MRKKPTLIDKHKSVQRETVLKWVKYNMDWKNVTFSDEKSFNPDGPDGSDYYCYNLRRAKDIRWSRCFKGGFLVLWGAVSWNGEKHLVVVSNAMNTEVHQKILGVHILPYCTALEGKNYIFQQDAATCHISRAAKIMV